MGCAGSAKLSGLYLSAFLGQPEVCDYRGQYRLLDEHRKDQRYQGKPDEDAKAMQLDNVGISILS